MGNPAIYDGKFLSTPSARRATQIQQLHNLALLNFYPRPPRGGRLLSRTRYFAAHSISIHALREEGDPSSTDFRWRRCSYFYPRPPRGGRPSASSTSTAPQNFYPRPPRGGRRDHRGPAAHVRQISIHALREEGDLSGNRLVGTTGISIHALREEGDTRCRSEPTA